MDIALERGDMQMVQWLHRYFPCGLVRDGLNAVASHGDWSLVEWLHEHHDSDTLEWSGADLEAAVASGRLDVVKWLCSNTELECANSLAEIAEQNGPLEMLQWLHEISHERAIRQRKGSFDWCTATAWPQMTSCGRLIPTRWCCVVNDFFYKSAKHLLDEARRLSESSISSTSSEPLEGTVEHGPSCEEAKDARCASC